jgi:hypothetical protein
MSHFVFAALPTAQRANHYTGGWFLACCGDDHDIVQFLSAGQDGDQDFCPGSPSQQVYRPTDLHPATMLSS